MKQTFLIKWLQTMYCVFVTWICFIYSFQHTAYTWDILSWLLVKLPRTPLIARFMGPTWGPSGADRTQVGPMLTRWTFAIWAWFHPSVQLLFNDSLYVSIHMNHFAIYLFLILSTCFLSSRFDGVYSYSNWISCANVWIMWHVAELLSVMLITKWNNTPMDSLDN